MLEIVPGLYFDIFSNLTNHSVCFLLPIQIKSRSSFFIYFIQCHKTILCQGKGQSSITCAVVKLKYKCSSGPYFKGWPTVTYLIRSIKLEEYGKSKKYKIPLSHQKSRSKLKKVLRELYVVGHQKGFFLFSFFQQL